MKGISTVIATILMLMITISLAGTAYLYISGAFTQQIQGLEVVDSFCSGGTAAKISFRNIGTVGIGFVNGVCNPAAGNTATCGNIGVTRTSGAGTASLGGGANPTASPAATTTVDSGVSDTLTDSICASGGTPRTCVYRITPPSGRSIVATVSCTG